MKMLSLAKYPRSGPSSRYRLYQFIPFLESAGIAVDVHTLHDERYLERRFRGEPVATPYLAARAVSRLVALAGVKHYHLLFVQKEIFPHAPALAEALLQRMGVKIVLDIDDAIFLPYRGTRLEHKVDHAIARSHLVLAGNHYLADYARSHNPNVVHFPTVVDTGRFAPAAKERRDPPRPVVGWIGSPATSDYLRAVMPALEAAAREVDFTLLVIGDESVASDGLAVETRAWREDSEVDDLRAMDVGIMPLGDDEWSEGKCALKLLQYMSTGLATVSTPTRAVREIVDSGENGMLAATAAQWTARVVELVRDATRRRVMGEKARAWVEGHYNLASYGPRLASYLLAASKGKEIADG